MGHFRAITRGFCAGFRMLVYDGKWIALSGAPWLCIVLAVGGVGRQLLNKTLLFLCASTCIVVENNEGLKGYLPNVDIY